MGQIERSFAKQLTLSSVSQHTLGIRPLAVARVLLSDQVEIAR